MKILLRPSIARRLFSALLLSFVLVALVLLGHDYYQYRQAAKSNPALQLIGQTLADSLAKIDNAQEATNLVRGIESQYNTLRQNSTPPQLENLVFQLLDRNGRLLYTSSTVGKVITQGRNNQVTIVTLNKRLYWLYSADAGAWSLRFAEPTLENINVLVEILRNMLPDLLLAFPFVLLPIWLAVRSGLKPLRQFSLQIANRDAEDLTPLAMNLKYAELKPVVESFNDILGRLRHKVERERAFVQDAAHELRTPMAVIGAQAHVLARAESAHEKQDAKQALDLAIARASHLSQQLLSLFVLEHNTPNSLQEMDVAHLVQSILAQFAPAAFARNVELSLDAPDTLDWTIKPAAFQSIIQNLIDNALRYGREDGQIMVSMHADRTLKLRVSDDGPGIPPAERRQVFERFYRGSGHDIPGTGLGLAIVERAVLTMSGKVWLEDGLNGHGVSFVIELPRGAGNPFSKT